MYAIHRKVLNMYRMITLTSSITAIHCLYPSTADTTLTFFSTSI